MNREQTPERFQLPQSLTPLMGVPNWVCYRLQYTPGKAKPTKPPVNPRTGWDAKSTDPSTWGTFAEAVNAWQHNYCHKGDIHGVGIELGGNGLAGIDIDHCLDENGNPSELARDVISLLASYTEVSPSGTGVHILFYCNVPFKGAKDDARGLEVYRPEPDPAEPGKIKGGRYFTVTGNVYGAEKPVNERSRELLQFLAKYFPEAQNTPKPKQAPEADRHRTGNAMPREAARQYIRASWEDLCWEVFDPAQKPMWQRRKSFICPVCGHGKGGDGVTVNPASADRNGLKCFSCGMAGDIIDFYRAKQNCDYNTALHELADRLGVEIERYNPRASLDDFTDDGIEAPQQPQTAGNAVAGDNEPIKKNTQQAATQTATDCTAYYRECRERLSDPAAVSYLQARGITVATAEAAGIGFDPAADPAGAGYPTPRIIVPTSRTHYVGISLDPKHQYPKIQKKGGEPGIFNEQALYTHDAQEVFVCEGAFDALSVIEAGAVAVALNSTSNARKLLQLLESHRTTATMVLCLDNDNAGQTATKELRDGLQRLNIGYITADICGGYKDPNEAFVSDRRAFLDAVAETQYRLSAKPDNVANYIANLMAGDIEKFKSDKKTGFSNLDEKTGGLYAGLYAVAAISSLGKTTFVHQMADQLAAAGHDVLFFSLEQSRLELVSKSIARITAQNDMSNAVSSLSIRKGYLPPQVQNAAQQYAQSVADRMSVIEGNFACNISFIGDYIRQYIRRNDTRPVVVIDYLQILQPETNQQGRQQTTKETVDTTVTELKRLSREMGLTVFVISSVNRNNYLTPIAFESLKESGLIEYTADVVWGLQLQCLNQDTFNTDPKTKIKEKREIVKRAKAENPRKLELVCLKNRYGVATFSCNFDYYPANDLFVPTADTETDSNDYAGVPARGRKSR